MSDGGYPRAPDLQQLVEQYGGYDKITPEAWARHDEAMRKWHVDRRIYTAGQIVERKGERGSSS